MRYTRPVAASAIALTAALALSACGSAGTASNANADINGTGKTVTIWTMDGDYSPETIAAINKEFTAKTGAKVNVQIQEWDGITTKVSTALATSTPPDVLDLGNTQVAGYAANGGLLDLTKNRASLEQGQTWLAGLVDPAMVGGHLYGVSGFAGDRAVEYNKKIWAAAGITSEPKTYSELTADLDKIKATQQASDFSAFYYPADDFKADMQFVWAAGGDIATKSGGSWKGAMESPAAQRGLETFKSFVNTYSTPASRTVGPDVPDQDQIFASGKAAAVLGTVPHLALIKKDNPQLTDADLGTFPFPGASGPQPVMLGGSDWGVAAKSANPGLALTWLKIATSPSIQDKWVFGKDGWIPNSKQAVASAASSVPSLQKAFFTAALSSKATPAAASWSTMEGDKSIDQLFVAVATGAKSPAQAAKDFDDHLNSVLAKDK